MPLHEGTEIGYKHSRTEDEEENGEAVTSRIVDGFTSGPFQPTIVV